MQAITRNAAARRRSVVTFLFFFLLVVVVFFVFLVLVNLLEFERIRGNDLEIAAALRAGNYVAFFDVIFFNVQIGVAFGTQSHLHCLRLSRASTLQDLMSAGW